MSLEKEYMQIFLAILGVFENIVKSSQGLPSINKNTPLLLNYTIIGSSNPRKRKEVKVTFYNNRAVGTNSNLLSRHWEKLFADRNIRPTGSIIGKDKFESVDLNDHRGPYI
ncbi:hypothetical protein H5410_038615 [Solanum commersonii]|uniref:Uncharacterized protein n=1 Tax=Solanum commersonii TaxID=4109 RepID=A0A9J5YBV6_SOLCO|nr:hypothetical protein H5410_038615 [Solanum commersonii]